MMLMEQTATLVAMVAVMERREPSIPEVEIWHSAIGGMDEDIAREAVNIALREVTGFIKASHVFERRHRAELLVARKRRDAAYPGLKEHIASLSRETSNPAAVTARTTRREIEA